MDVLRILEIVAIVVGSAVGSGGILTVLINRDDKKKKEQMDDIKEGIKLGLENDAVIFKALREHKINGESEAQEQKMNAYFRKSFIK